MTKIATLFLRRKATRGLAFRNSCAAPKSLGCRAPRVSAGLAIRGLSVLFTALFVLLFGGREFGLGFGEQRPVGSRPPKTDVVKYDNTMPRVRYVGSKTCGKCHQSIYEEFVQTPMGRSMSLSTQSLQTENIPVPATVFDAKANQYIQVFGRESALYMRIYGLDANGKAAFKHTERLAYAIGSGVNAVGYLIERGNYLFQAPLAFYTCTHSWDLAPGYGQIDFGFSRPVTTPCIVCHSGLPRPVRNSTTGLYQDPPFQELAIGCERCHGPGSLHVEARLRGAMVSGNIDKTIVNPAELPVWLANNICMSCHQGEDAWVLKNGKDYTDFRPGTPLDTTFAVFAVPPQKESPGSLPLLDHYFQMTLSRCFRLSGGRMGCLTCHDPHVWPTPAQASAYFRQKCLTCHTNQSCALPLERRLHQNPPNNCIGCHMQQLDVQHAAHSDVTNHRIIAYPGEAYPTAFPTAGSSGLIYLDALPGTERAPVAPLILLQAYGQVIGEQPNGQYKKRFSKLLDQLAKPDGNNVVVLRALAERAAAQGTSAGNQQAIEYLERALESGSKEPGDRLLLGDLLLREGRAPEAVRDASFLVTSDPYNPLCYLLLASAFMVEGSRDKAMEVINNGLNIYPENTSLRRLVKKINSEKLHLEDVH